MPGSIPACSSITAWMCGADITLSSRPSASRLGTTVPCGAYAASSGSPGANRCRGTAANAAATGSDLIAPSSRSVCTMAARSSSAWSGHDRRPRYGFSYCLQWLRH